MKNFLERNKVAIGIILAIVPFAFTTVSKWNEPKTELSATIERISSPIPSKLADNYYFSILDSKIDSIFSSHNNQTEKLLFLKLQEDIKYEVRKSLLFDELHRFSFNYCTFGKLTISNIGDKEIRDIEVSAPYKTFYEFAKNEKSIATGLINEKIGIGSLRSTEKIVVRLWGRSLNDNEISITFPDGALNPKGLKKVSGGIAFIAEYLSNIWLNLYLLIILLLLIARLCNFYYEKGYRLAKSNNK
jgi:hypothetical protein